MFKFFKKKQKQRNTEVSIYFKGVERPLVIEFTNRNDADRIAEQFCNDDFIAVVSSMSKLILNCDKILYIEIEG